MSNKSGNPQSTFPLSGWIAEIPWAWLVKLARANAELERKVQVRTAQLREANANLEAFTSTAAHDLRSPLTAIKNFSEIVAEDYGEKLRPEGRSMLERIAASADQMHRLLNDLLEYSRISQAELKLEPVGLRRAVSEALALLDEDIRERAWSRSRARGAGSGWS